MQLDRRLIKEFAKLYTEPSSKSNKETYAYGKAIVTESSVQVILDGATSPTPVGLSMGAEDGDRVMVLIKDHSATIVGNMTSPSNTASQSDKKYASFDKIVAVEGEIANLSSKVITTETLTAEVAKLGYATIGQLEATDAKIETLESKSVTTDNLSAKVAELGYATIGQLEATEAKITTLEAKSITTDNLSAKVAELGYATIGQLEATDAKIETLESKSITTDNLSAKVAELGYATIGRLEATEATIGSLSTKVANIDSLIFKDATGGSITVDFANAVAASFSSGVIKNAMIDNLSVDKIASGTISTNKFTIGSDDGKTVLADNTLQFSDENRVRIQIGKDSTGDYNLTLVDKSGNVLWNANGLQGNAIRSDIITNEMISNNTAISGSKIDLQSLVKEINDSTETIKASNIYFDESSQTLNIALQQLKTNVSDTASELETLQTDFTLANGKLSSVIAESSQTKSDLATVSGQVNTNKSNISTLTQDLSGFKTTVSETYTTKTDFNNLEIGGRNYFSELFTTLQKGTFENGIFTAGDNDNRDKLMLKVQQYGGNKFITGTQVGISNVLSNTRIVFPVSTIVENCEVIRIANNGLTSEFSIFIDNRFNVGDEFIVSLDVLDNTVGGCKLTNIKLEKGNKATDWTPAPEDVDSAIETVDGKFSNYSTTTEMNSAISQSKSDIKLEVSETYTTKAEFDDLAIGGRNLILKQDNDYIMYGTTTGVGVDCGVVDSTSPTGYHTYFSLPTRSTLRGIYYDYKVNSGDIDTMILNEVYTISFYARTDYTSNITLDYGSVIADQQIINYSDMTLTNAWNRYFVTFEYTNSSTLLACFYTSTATSTASKVYVAGIKIELGNKATDYIPSYKNYSTTEQTKALIKVESDKIELKVDKNGVVSAINQTAEQIKIDASKIDLNGYVTVTDLEGDGTTIINGSNITTGTIDASLVDVINIKAENIEVGTLSGFTIVGSAIQSAKYDGNTLLGTTTLNDGEFQVYGATYGTNLNIGINADDLDVWLNFNQNAANSYIKKDRMYSPALECGEINVNGDVTIAKGKGIVSNYNLGRILWDHNNGNVTVNGAGGYLRLGHANTSYVNTPVAFYSDKTINAKGGLYEYDVALANKYALQSTFATSTAANGYVKLQGGVIIQWGTVNITPTAANTNTQVTVTYPIAFNTTTRTVSAIPYTSGANSTFVSFNGWTNSNFNLVMYRTAATKCSIKWMVIGY